MTVITGETGAGKSIILDALNLALGQRSDSQLIRPGCEKCEIAATFEISSLSGAILWLTDLELSCEESPQVCIIRRIIYANGRSKAFINGRPVTIQQLRLLGDYVVQIHGQHQHQLLLKAHEQLRLLDAFGQHDVLLSQVKTAYKAWDNLNQSLEQLKANGSPEQSRLDLLHYQIAELEALGVQANELEKLHQEHDELAHGATYIHAIEQTLNLLEQNEEANALSLTSFAQSSLKTLTDKFPSLHNVKECLANAHIQLQEAICDLHDFSATLEINPERLHEVSIRLERIHDMARKHRIAPEELLQHYEKLKNEVKQYADIEISVKKVEQDLALSFDQYQRVAKALTTARIKASEKLGYEITEKISQLGMPGGLFKVQLVPQAPGSLHAFGNESVIFNVSANPGHAPQPLSKVASGGELSRISLALELLSAKFLSTPSLVFDEVDVGISGKTGSIVGRALHDLSQSAQVLCITHLPQVAAIGDHHIQVTKLQQENSTSSDIQFLNTQQRVEEIARLLGGIDITAQARANAKALLKKRKTEEVIS